MRQKATLTRDVTLAALRGQVSDRTARTYFQGNREVRADVQAGQKIGENVAVLDASVPPAITPEEEQSLIAQEAELTARLEAIRERRGA